MSHRLDRTLTELYQESSDFRAELQTFLDGLVSHYVFDVVRQQYASVSTAARMGLGEAVGALQLAVVRGVDVGVLLEQHKVRLDLADRAT